MKVYTYVETNFDRISKNCVFRTTVFTDDLINYQDAIADKLTENKVQTSFTIDNSTIKLYTGSIYSNNIEIVIECPDDISKDIVESLDFLDKLVKELNKITEMINDTLTNSYIGAIPIGIILFQDNMFYKAIEKGKDNNIAYEHLMATCLLDKDDISMIIEEILDNIE